DNNLKRIKENIENNAAQPGDAAAWELATHHFKHGVRAYQVRETPEKYVLMFSYWNVNELLDLSNSSGELPQCKYIRASCEPFNDEMYVDEAKLMAWLDKFKISYDPDVTGGQTIVKRKHVSGHASKPELEDLIKNLSPKVVYPVHTEDPGAFKGMVPAGVTVVDTIIPGKEYAV
nr:MBL fold metallo-hydrolase RNA specificity domain-containing protein [Candidatus Sigynarchaeota archaeon]